MSTRCNVIIHDQYGNAKAMLYQHCDGYPENMLGRLERLERQSKRVLADQGYSSDDPEKLAGMMVVLSANDAGVPRLMPCLNLHWDIEYLYHVYIYESGDSEVIVERCRGLSVSFELLGHMMDSESSLPEHNHLHLQRRLQNL